MQTFVTRAASAALNADVARAAATSAGRRGSAVKREGMVFPDLSGENLDGERLAFPHDFRRRTVALIAFDLKQREEIESWIPFVDRHVRAGRVDGRMFAVIPHGMRMMKGMILKTMRAGAPSPEARAATVPLFADIDAFCTSLGIADRSAIAITVIDPGGIIVAQRSGRFTDAAGAAIDAALGVTI